MQQAPIIVDAGDCWALWRETCLTTCALVPITLYGHQHRYSQILAHVAVVFEPQDFIAKLAALVPAPRPQTGPDPEPAVPRSRNYRWAELMKRVFLADVLRCESCGGEMKVLAVIHPPLAQRLLDCLGLPARAPPVRAPVPDIDR